MQHIVMHNIDATDLRNTLDSNNSDKKNMIKIIFNFPLAPLTKTLEDVKNSPSPVLIYEIVI